MKKIIIIALLLAGVVVLSVIQVGKEVKANNNPLPVSVATNPLPSYQGAFTICQGSICARTKQLIGLTNFPNCYATDASTSALFCGDFVVLQK